MINSPLPPFCFSTVIFHAICRIYLVSFWLHIYFAWNVDDYCTQTKKNPISSNSAMYFLCTMNLFKLSVSVCIMRAREAQ